MHGTFAGVLYTLYCTVSIIIMILNSDDDIGKIITTVTDHEDASQEFTDMLHDNDNQSSSTVSFILKHHIHWIVMIQHSFFTMIILYVVANKVHSQLRSPL